MIAIEFECNTCKSKEGKLEVQIDDTFIVCKKCGDYEEIADIDIVVHCEDVTE